MTTTAQHLKESDAITVTRICSCSHCKTENTELEYLEHEGKILCRDCFHELASACSRCGEVFWKSEMIQVNGLLHCQECLDTHFCQCSACEMYVPNGSEYHSDLDDFDYCEICFSERVTYCRECEAQINPDTCYRDEGDEPFCDECWDNRESDNSPRYPEFSGTSFTECRSPRKYGIEIEAVVKGGKEHLPHERLKDWRQVTDGSLGDDGREYVSPILQGDEGFREIRKFSGVLQGWGYFVNRSCGLHVHIDGRDLGCEDIKKLLKVTRYFEPVLYAMLPESRHEGSYSVPLERFPKSRFRIAAKDEEALKRLWYGPRGSRRVDLKSKYHHSRYYGLNIHSWFFRRSLEFRYHSGTLNAQKITNFIEICQALVDKSRELKTFKMKTNCDFKEQFEEFVSFLDVPAKLTAYMRDRISKFHPERFCCPAI